MPRITLAFSLCASLLLFGCDKEPTDADNDGDSFPASLDCDDNNNTVNPGALEIEGNGLDDDCDPRTSDILPLQSDDFLDQLLELYCTQLEDCMGGGDTGGGISFGDCMDITDDVADDTRSCDFNAEAAAACLDLQADADCDDYLDVIEDCMNTAYTDC